MSLLSVEPDGLARLAADCGTWSVEVAATAAPTIPGGLVQATTAAVDAVNVAAGLTAEMLSARMRFTAATLKAAARAYSAQDAESTIAFGELATGR